MSCKPESQNRQTLVTRNDVAVRAKIFVPTTAVTPEKNTRPQTRIPPAMKNSPLTAPPLTRKNLLTLCLGLTLAASTSLRAAIGVDTWNGGANPNFNWNVAGNWTGANTPPLTNDILVFSGSTGLLNTNNFTVATNSITFSATAGAFNLFGNSLTLIGGITNSSSALETVNLPLTLGGNATLSSVGALSVVGAISGSYNLTSAGTGTVYLTNAANSYSGVTVIGAGTVVNVASLGNYGVNSCLGNRASSAETTSADSATGGIGLHFTGGTLQYTGTGAQSCNRQIRLLNGNGGTIDASGATPASTLSFTYSGANVNLFDTVGTRTLTLTGSNTGNNTFAIALQDQGSSATSLQKSGVGTWVITATNTYSGATTINAGTLIISGTGELGNGNYSGAITDNGALVYNSTANQTLNGLISGTGTLTQQGSGTLTLTGGNTYSGATTISGGELVFVTTASPTIGSVSVTPASGVATLGVVVGVPNTQMTCSSVSFNAGGTGTGLEFGFNTAPSTTTAPLNVTGNLTFGVTPAVTVDLGAISAGTYPLVTVGGTAPSAVPTVTLNPVARQGTLSASLAWGGSGFSANTLVMTVTGSSPEPLNWTNSTAGLWDANDATNTVWQTSGATPTATYYQQSGLAADRVVFGTNVTANTTVTLNSVVTPASVTVTNSTYTYTISGSGAIGGSGGLVKSGSGTLNLSTANTYTGGTVISAGVVNATGGSSLGGNGSTVVNGTLNLLTGSTTYNGTTTGLSGNGTVNVVVSTGGNSTILSTGGATAANYTNFTGTINIGTNAPTVASSGKGVITANMGAATINVFSNATLYVSGPETNGSTATLYGGTMGEAYGQLRLDGGVVWNGNINIAGQVIGSSSGQLGGNSGANTINGVVSQAPGVQTLVKIGGSTLILAGTNTFTCPTVVNGGTLDFIGNQTNATGGYYVGTNGATVYLNLGLATQTVPTSIAVASTNTVYIASPGTTYSQISSWGAPGLPTYVTNNGTLVVGRDSAFNINAYATWVQNNSVVVQANGGYPANFIVATNGTLVVNPSIQPVISAPSSSGSANITDNGNVIISTNIVFNDNGSTGYPYFALANSGVLSLGNNVSPIFTSTRTNATSPLGQVWIGTNGTLNLNGYSASITNRIVNASGTSGSLVVTGGGTLTLTDTNAYSGGTTVNGSTLVLANGGAYGVVINNVTLNSNAVLQLNNVDSLGYWGGISVSNINVNNSIVTNNSGGNEGYAISYVLNNGQLNSSGGAFLLAGGSISSLANANPSSVNAPITVRNNLLTLNPAAGSTASGDDLILASNLYAFDEFNTSSAPYDNLVKNGPGTVLLLATNGLNGNTTINAGTLALGPNAVMNATTNIGLAAGATFDVSAQSPYTLTSSEALSGSGTVNGSVSDSNGSQFNPGGSGVGTLTITTNLTLVGGETFNFNFTTNGNSEVVVGGTLNPQGSTIINLATWPTGGFKQTNYVLFQAASLGGSAGSFYLENVPSGGRQAYTVVYNTSSSPQQVLLQVAGYNANLVWQGGGNWDVDITQDWLNGGSSDYFYTSDNVLFGNVPPANAYVNISGPSIAPGTVVINSTNNYLIAGGSITGGAALTKNGSGTTILDNANTYTGGTTINGGTLQLGDNTNTQGSVSGSIVNNGTLAVAVPLYQTQTLSNNLTGTGNFVALGAGTLTLAGPNSIGGSLSANGSELILTGSNSVAGGLLVSTGLVVVSSPSALANTPAQLANINTNGVVLLGSTGAFTFTNTVTGAGSLIFSNTSSSIITLVSSNSLSGGVTDSGGILLISNVNALGTGPVTIDNHINGLYSQLYLANGMNFTNPVTIINGSDYYDGILMVNPGTGGSGGGTDTNSATFSGPITIEPGTLGHGSDFCGPIYGPGWLTVNGPVIATGSANPGIRNGRVLFGGGGNYTAVGVAAGLLGLSANNGVCTNAYMNVAGSGAATFDLRGFNQTLAGLSDGGNVTYAEIVTNSSATPSMLTLNLNGYYQYTGFLAGNLGVTINGNGQTFVMQGTNTYTGNTVIESGTLQLGSNTTLSNSAVLYLSNNATLNVNSGSLTINHNQTLEGAGAFNIYAALTNNGTIVLNVNKSGAGIVNDTINGLASMTCGGTLQLNLTGSPLAVGDSFTLINASSYSGAFTNIVPATPGPGLAWDTSNLAINGSLAVVTGVSLVSTNLTGSYSGGYLNLAWPADHTGWRLLVQTNHLATGLSTNPSDWGTVSGSTTTNAVSLPVNPALPAEFYELVYP